MSIAEDKNPLVSIVMINYNGLKYLQRTIPAILDLDYGNKEFIIVDNGSADGSLEFIESFREVKLLKSPRLREKNFACNYGVNNANGEYVLLCDNDALVNDKNILAKLIKNAEKFNDFGCFSLAFHNEGEGETKGYGVFSSIIYDKNNKKIKISNLAKLNNIEISYPNGLLVFFKKETWLNLGGYDDALQFGGDDSDLGMKLWMNGYKCYLYSESAQIHIGMEERNNNAKYCQKFKNLILAHLYTIVKNFNKKNVLPVFASYSAFLFLKTIKQVICRRYPKLFLSLISGYFLFIKRLPRAIRKRALVQKNRKIKEDVFLRINPPQNND